MYSSVAQQASPPPQDRVFLSDILGSSFLDADVKAAAVAPPVCPEAAGGGSGAVGVL